MFSESFDTLFVMLEIQVPKLEPDYRSIPFIENGLRLGAIFTVFLGFANNFEELKKL